MANETPVATAEAGGGWSSVNSGLNNVLNIWAQVEQIKGAKAAAGADVTQARTVPELANGAAITVDSQLTQTTDKNESVITIAGVNLNKNITYGTGALLVLMLVYKKFIK